MLTQEQIKNLKPGDPIVIKTRFDHIDSGGDIWFAAPAFNNSENTDYICPDYVSLPSEIVNSQSSTVNSQSKLDPCRPFKAGDIVTPQRINGRSYDDIVRKKEGLLFRVVHDETSAYIISIKNEEGKHYINPAFLLLITPVEEIEPFGVRYSTDKDCAEVYHRRYKNTVAAFYCKCGITREQAEAHAEAEAASLNEEWRKEQNHD